MGIPPPFYLCPACTLFVVRGLQSGETPEKGPYRLSIVLP